MKKRTTIVCLVVGVILLVGYLLKDVRPGEPHHKRKALSVWLTGYDPWTGDRWMRSDEAVKAMGTNALPHLIRLLRVRYSEAENLRRMLLSPANRVRIPTDSDWHCRAMRACEALGQQAAPALPELQSFFLGRQTQSAAMPLLRIGPDGVRVLIEALANPREEVRCAAAHALEFAPSTNAAAAAPGLIRLLKDPATCARSSAARGLSAFPSSAPLSVAPLIECLRDPESWVRRDVIYALGHYGKDADPAVPDLIRLFNEDPDDHVRFLARAYLYQINANAAREAGVDLNAPVRSSTRR